MTVSPPSYVFHPDSGRGSTRSIRAVGLAITGAVHVVAVAVAAAAFGWQGPETRSRETVSRPLTFALRQPEEPRDLPKLAAAAPSRAAAVISIDTERAPPAHLDPAAPSVSEAPALAGQSARSDDLSQVTLSYRRAIMARLEAQRRYPHRALRSGWQGSGAVVFRIGRSGRLLDATVADGTGRPTLDDAAIGIVRRAAPFPAIPEGLPDELAITMPVSFLIDGSADAAVPAAVP